MEARIASIIREYSEQGIHRTGTEVDNQSALWLANCIEAYGVKAELDPFSLQRVVVHKAEVQFSSLRFSAEPLHGCDFTDEKGISGTLGELGSKADIALVVLSNINDLARGPIREARRVSEHKGFIVTNDLEFPPDGIPISNAEDFPDPLRQPTLHVSGEDGLKLKQSLRREPRATIIFQGKRVSSMASNVGTKILGTDPDLKPIVVMTPRSGWWACASERAGGIAMFLEIIRNLTINKPKRTVLFTANSGHELDHLGMEHFLHSRKSLVRGAAAWIHIGANFSAKGAYSTLQYSNLDLQRLAGRHFETQGISADRITPPGTRPLGEARNIFDGDGDYISIVASNPLFHHPADVWPDAVNMANTVKWAQAFTNLVSELSNRN